jgi:hypothetical protein
VPESLESYHKEQIEKAIQEGKIKSHPDYPELTKKKKPLKKRVKKAKPTAKAPESQKATALKDDLKTLLGDKERGAIGRLSPEQQQAKARIIKRVKELKDIWIKKGLDKIQSFRKFLESLGLTSKESRNALMASRAKKLVDEEVDREFKERDIPQDKSQVVEPEHLASTEAEMEASAQYETIRNRWLGEKAVDVIKAANEKKRLQTELRESLGKKKYDAEVQDIDKAIQIYIDTKRSPDHFNQYYDKLTPEQKKIADLSQNLSKEAKATADKISESYKKIGLEALEEDVIRNVLDNYAGRIWETPKGKGETFRKFGITTRHAKQRKFTTILEGMANGFNLEIEGATSNLEILKQEIDKTIEDKRFIKSLQKIKDIDGNPLLSTKQLEGYTKVEHPNFKIWKRVGQEVEGDIYKNARNFFVTEDGIVYERKELYAPKEQANNLNNILGISKLEGVPGIRTATKYNAIFKAWILQSSFFHHMAFARSYYLGTNKKTWKEMNLRQAWRQGVRMVEQEHPLIMHGIRNGLTLNLRQDWEEHLLREKTIFGKVLDKTKASKFTKDKINSLRQQQTDFLFGEMGAGLKAKAFQIEYRNQIQEHPSENPDVLAERVADLINDDFGGLNLKRMGRNPTLQHIFRLMALAPDWTESNVRSMVKVFSTGGDKAKRRFYQKFWTGVLMKGATATVLANFLMAGGDDEEFVKNYKIAWEQGNLKWMAVDITPLYKLLGGKTLQRKYFTPIGHFKDVFKFISHPIRSAKHKGSVLFKFFQELLTGKDWAGRRYTTAAELLGIDDKGKYKTSRKGKYRKGDPKGGKLAGKTVTWGYGGGGPVEFPQIPSFALAQIRGLQPVQVQNLMSWLLGEMEGFDAIGNSMGLGITSTYNLEREDRKNKKKRIRTAEERKKAKEEFLERRRKKAVNE